MLRGIDYADEAMFGEPLSYSFDNGERWSVIVPFTEGVRVAAGQQGLTIHHARPTLILHILDGAWLPTMTCHNFPYGDATAYRRACLSVGAWVAGLRL